MCVLEKNKRSRNVKKRQEPELTTGFKYDILPELSLSQPSAFQHKKEGARYHLETAGVSGETGNFLGSLKCRHRSGRGQHPPGIRPLLSVPGFLLGSPRLLSFQVQAGLPLGSRLQHLCEDKCLLCTRGASPVSKQVSCRWQLAANGFSLHGFF